MTDQDWLTDLLAALEGKDWVVERSRVTTGLPFAFAAVHHPITNERKVVYLSVRLPCPRDLRKAEILRQLAS
jgi:hypothetical protein